MTIRHAKLSLNPVVAVSLLLAWPEPVLYGVRTVETEIPGVTGHDCTFSDKYKDTDFPLIYNTFLCVAVLTEMVSLVVLYAFILRVLRKHRQLLKDLRFNTVTLPQGTATGRQSVVCVVMDTATSIDTAKPIWTTQSTWRKWNENMVKLSKFGISEIAIEHSETSKMDCWI